MRGGCLFSLIVMSFVPSVLCPEPARPPASPLSSVRRPPVLRLTPVRPLFGVCPVLRPTSALSSARRSPVLCRASALSFALAHPVLPPAAARPLSGVCPVLRPGPPCPPSGACLSSLRRPPCPPPWPTLSSTWRLPVLCPAYTLSSALAHPVLRPAPARPLSGVRLSSVARLPAPVLKLIRVPWVSCSRSHRPPLQQIILSVLIRYSAEHFKRYSDRCSVVSIACTTACMTDCSQFPARLSDSMPNHTVEGARRAGRRQRSWVPRSSRVPGGSTAVPDHTQMRSRGGGARFPLYFRFLFPYCVIYLIGTALDGGYRVRLNRKKTKMPDCIPDGFKT